MISRKLLDKPRFFYDFLSEFSVIFTVLGGTLFTWPWHNDASSSGAYLFFPHYQASF